MPTETFSSAREEGNGGGTRVLKEDADHAQMINKIADAVITKLAFSDPSRTFTPDQKNDIQRQLCRLSPVSHMPNHPTYAVMIHRAIKELNEKLGSTEEGISKFIREKFDDLPLAHARFLSLHLKKLNEMGEIVCVSTNCYMLPSDKDDSLTGRKLVPDEKQTQNGRGKRKSYEEKDHKALAEEQAEVIGKQRKKGKQSQEPQYCKAVGNHIASYERENKQYEVNGRQRRSKVEETVAISEKQSQEQVEEDQQSKVIKDQKGFPDAQQVEVIRQKSQDIVVMVVPLSSAEPKSKVLEGEQVDVTEQQQQHQQQRQEPVQAEQHGTVINCQNGSSTEENVQQDEVNRLKSQNQVQVPGVIVERQNVEQTYKGDEIQVEATAEGTGIQDSIETEQHGKMIEDEYGSTDEQKDIQEVTLIVKKRNIEVKKYQVNEEHVEVIEHLIEHVKHSEEPIQNLKVIDYQNGSSKEKTEQKGEVNGQQTENQMQVTAVFVEKSNFSEQPSSVTEQQRRYGQQILEEQNRKVNGYQNGSPVQQNEWQDDVTEDQSQEISASREKQIETKLKYKVADEHIEEQCQTTESEQHSQNGKRDCRLHGEISEAILTGPEAWQIDMISERNRPEDQSELISIPELLFEMHEKDAATAVNSNVSIASQKFSHHIFSNLSELVENNIKVQEKTHKLLENDIKVQEKTHKLLENNIKVQEEALQVQEKLFELFKELRETIRNPVIANRPLPVIGSCGNMEYVGCGFSAKEKNQPDISGQKKALESQLNKMSAALELPTDATDLFLKQGKVCDLGQEQVPKCHNKSVMTLADAEQPQQQEIGNPERLVCDFGQEQEPKCHNKSVMTLADAEQPQQQEIGNSERLWELPTMEAENVELFGPLRKKIRLSIEANHEKEKQLQVYNPEGHPDFWSKEKQSLSLLVPSYQDVCVCLPNYEPETQQSKVRKTERPLELKSLSVEGGVKAHVSKTNLIEPSVDLSQEEQKIVPQLTWQENLQEREHEMQSFSQVKQQEVVSEVLKTLDCVVATVEDQEVENVIKDKGLKLELTASDQSCRTQLEQKQQQMQIGLLGKQPSESGCEAAEAPKSQDEDHQTEKVIKEKAATSASEQQPWLRPRVRKSAKSDCEAATAPKCQEQQHTREPIQERMLDQKPVEQRQLHSMAKRHSESELSLIASMVESSPRKNQDTGTQTEDKTEELKTSADKTGQKQVKQRQLRPRNKNLSEFKHSLLSNTGMSRAEEPYQLKRQSQVKKPGVGNPSEPKKRKWGTPEKQRGWPKKTMDSAGPAKRQKEEKPK